MMRALSGGRRLLPLLVVTGLPHTLEEEGGGSQQVPGKGNEAQRNTISSTASPT